MVKKFYDPYLEVIKKFNQHKIKYVVIGVAGINYYANDARKLFVTADFDMFVLPEELNVTRALNVVKTLNFKILWQGKHLKKITKGVVKKILQKKKPVLCIDPFYNLVVELCLEVSGYNFEEVYSDKKTFYAEGVKINVGKLEKLLRMKELAGRKKDIEFLKKYRLLVSKN